MRTVRLLLITVLFLCLALALASCNDDKSAPEENVASDSATLVQVTGFSITDGSLEPLTVPASVDAISFLDRVKVKEGATWTVSADRNGEKPLMPERIELQEGDNEFYLSVVPAENEQAVIYPVRIRRKPVLFISGGVLTGISEEFRQLSSSQILLSDYEGTEPFTKVGARAFYGCTGLQSVVLPDGITAIGDNAFAGCSSLAALNLPESVTEIGSSAFLRCSALTAITLPAGITEIKRETFYGCGLISVTLPDSVEKIGATAFYQCSRLTEIVIPDGVREIGLGAFTLCQSLRRVAIPGNVTKIGDNAFYDCYHLATVTLGDGIRAIGKQAFYDCQALTSISFPKSVASIGDRAFYGCGGLTDVTVDPENPTFASVGNCLIDKTTKTLIRGGKNSIIPTDGSVEVIGNYAFSCCKGLLSITIPQGVTTIEQMAFSVCSNLASVTIPDSVTSIGQEAFALCTSLTSVTIPGSVDSIGDFAFNGCKKLHTVVFGDGIREIGEQAFTECTALLAVTLPKSVVRIKSFAFSFCVSLTGITVDPENPAFSSVGNCLVEKSSKILLCGCKNSVIPTDGSVREIAQWAFAGYRGLTSIVIPEGTTRICTAAIHDCYDLTSVSIPVSVTMIDQYAISFCESLSEITYAGTIAQWDAIVKNDEWSRGAAYTIRCTDGNVTP